jgi:hypothetical protein
MRVRESSYLRAATPALGAVAGARRKPKTTAAIERSDVLIVMTVPFRPIARAGSPPPNSKPTRLTALSLAGLMTSWVNRGCRVQRIPER